MTETCFCKEPAKRGWIHATAFCYDAILDRTWFAPRNQTVSDGRTDALK